MNSFFFFENDDIFSLIPSDSLKINLTCERIDKPIDFSKNNFNEKDVYNCLESENQFKSNLTIIRKIDNKNIILKESLDMNLGIELNTIYFAKIMKLSSEHLSRHSCADLFLDTFNYNAQSTAMDSLWAGLPVVTVLGKSFCARVSGSLLKTINLSELIAKNIDEYESIIIHLANEPNQMEDIKKKLHNINGKYKLFNSEKLTNQLENVFSEIINREKANRSNSN